MDTSSKKEMWLGKAFTNTCLVDSFKIYRKVFIGYIWKTVSPLSLLYLRPYCLITLDEVHVVQLAWLGLA